VLRLEIEQLMELRRHQRGGGAEAERAGSLVEDAAAILVPSRTAWLEAYKLHTRPHDIEEIPPGVDLEVFRPGPASPEVLLRLDATGDPVLLAAGDADPSVDLETILRAFAVVHAQHRQALLLLSGVGTPPRELLESLRIDRGVRVVKPGEVAPAELMRAAKLLLLAHRLGNDEASAQRTGSSLLEAMACGVPVVATRTPATVEMVPEDEAGELVDPGAHAKLGRAALEVLEDASQYAAMSARAREIAGERYDVRANAARLGEFLDVLLSRRLRREHRPLVPPAGAPPEAAGSTA
jgi:glycosyltransferase involved in cell wall biosynthesis